MWVGKWRNESIWRCEKNVDAVIDQYVYDDKPKYTRRWAKEGIWGGTQE